MKSYVNLYPLSVLFLFGLRYKIRKARINVLLVKLNQPITTEFRLNIAFIKIAATNMNINIGILDFACLFDFINEIKSISGTNQSVLNNFTVVAVSSDSLLKDMAHQVLSQCRE